MIKSKWDNLFSFGTQLSTIIYAFQWVKVAKNNKTNMICILCTNVLLISDGVILLIKNLSCSFESLDILAKVVQFFRYSEQKILLEALGCLKTMIRKLQNFERLGAKLNALRFFWEKKSVIFFTKTDRICTGLVKINCLGGFCLFEPP